MIQSPFKERGIRGERFNLNNEECGIDSRASRKYKLRF